MICVSIGEKNWENAANEARKYPFTEIRLDYLENITQENVVSVFSSCKSRKIVTFRKKDSISDNERIIMIEAALNAGALYADADINNNKDFIKKVSDAVSGTEAEMIVSFHDFEKTPSVMELEDIIGKAADFGADIIKIACMCKRNEDVKRLLKLPSGRKNIVIAGMGELGKRTRALALFTGSLFTYACPDKGFALAPGQIPYSQLLKEQEVLKNVW